MSQYPPDHDPFSSPQSADAAWSDGASAARPPSGAVTAVAVLNYIMGVLNLTCAGCMSTLGLYLATVQASPEQGGSGFWSEFNEGFREGFEEKVAEDFGEGANADLDGVGELMGYAGLFVVVLGAFLCLMSLPSFMAGYGVQKRRQWGRISTIGLAVCSGLVAIVNIFQLSPAALIYGGYTVYTMIVLLKPEYAAEFR